MVSDAQPPEKPMTPPHAWQPFTPRGIAAFGSATMTRLWLVQCAVALLVAMACIWFASLQWFPVIEDAIRALPSETLISNGKLISGISAPTRLAGNSTLEIVINPQSSGSAGASADVTIVLGESDFSVCGVLGCVPLAYPRADTISLKREEVEPWWGAWRKAVAAGIGAAVFVKLMVVWWVLGMVFAPFVKLIAFFTDRKLTVMGSWRVACASLLPGAFIIIIGVVLYGLGACDVLRLGLCYILHIVCGIFLVATSPFFLPPAVEKRAKNPFAGGSPPASAPSKRGQSSDNPFGRR